MREIFLQVQNLKIYEYIVVALNSSPMIFAMSTHMGWVGVPVGMSTLYKIEENNYIFYQINGIQIIIKKSQ